MKDTFIELKTVDNQILYVRKSAVGAFEVAPPSQHVEGHIKLYVTGYKFLIKTEKNDLLKQLSEGL